MRVCAQLTETERQAQVTAPPQSGGGRSGANGSRGDAAFRIDLAGLKKLTDAPAGEVYDAGVVESAQVLCSNVDCACCTVIDDAASEVVV